MATGTPLKDVLAAEVANMRRTESEECYCGQNDWTEATGQGGLILSVCRNCGYVRDFNVKENGDV